MWLIIDKSDHTVAGTCPYRPPAGSWNLDLFDIKEWPGGEPPVHNPERGIESYDPTLGDPTWEAKAGRRASLPGAVAWLEQEADWLRGTMPAIPAMTLPELAAAAQRLARQNLRVMEVLEYYLWRLLYDELRHKEGLQR